MGVGDGGPGSWSSSTFILETHSHECLDTCGWIEDDYLDAQFIQKRVMVRVWK